MEAVNTKNLKFAPDVGQLQKGGADAAKVVKDFLPAGKAHAFEGLQGLGVVLRILPAGHGYGGYSGDSGHGGERGLINDVMVELDPSPDGPMTPLQTVQTTKAY